MENTNLFEESANLITSNDAARMIGSSINYINTLVKKGKLKPARILPTSKKRFFRQSDVEQYIKTMSNC